MDYSQHKQIEFRRKYWKIFGASIFMKDLVTQAPIGFIKLAAFRWKSDIRIYTDQTEQQEVFRIAARQAVSFRRVFDVFDSATNQQLFSIRQRALKSDFVRDHMELLDANENIFGDIIETSSSLALARRWIEVIPYIGPLIGFGLVFTKQTFNISLSDATGQNQVVGTVVHRRSPVVVRLNLDTSQAQTQVDSRLPVAGCALIAILDAVKSR